MRSCELACFAASVSMSRPVSRSWFCQACRKRLAAARAELYPRSEMARDDECLLRASADVDSIGARERMTRGKARCLPDNRRACPERGRRDAGAAHSEFTTRLCGKLTDAPRHHRGSLKWRTGVPPVHAGEGARATLNFHTNLHTESQEINLAKAKAAAAATPPMTIVCSALRPGPVPV